MRADTDTHDGDARRFRRRLKGLALVAFIGLGLLMARIAWLQVVRHDDYAVMAEQNRAAAQPSGQPPAGAK
jgi:penicillin-binding protein 2